MCFHFCSFYFHIIHNQRFFSFVYIHSRLQSSSLLRMTDVVKTERLWGSRSLRVQQTMTVLPFSGKTADGWVLREEIPLELLRLQQKLRHFKERKLYCRCNCQCDTLREIYHAGKCKKIERVNGVTQVPKWNREIQRLLSVLIGIIVTLVIVVAVIVFFFWLFFGKRKKKP